MDGVLLLLPDWVSVFESEFRLLRDGVSQSEVLGQFYNPNTTPKDKERVVVCLRGTGQELH